MTEKDKNTMLLTAGFFIIPMTLVLDGYVISILWGWFFATAFNLPAITIAQSLGIALFIRYFGEYDSEKKGKFSVVALESFLKPVFALLMGWLLRCLCKFKVRRGV